MKGNMKRLLALLLCLAMTLSLLTGCGSAGGDSSQAVETESRSPEVEEAEKEEVTASSLKNDKEETVYVKADASGAAQEITVQTSLKNPGNGKEIQDKTNLTDIKNTEGDEEFTQTGQNLIWENHGEDIQYEGKSGESLPISLNISYYLDEQPISPEELAGKSGKLRIRFDYENSTVQTVEVNGRQVETVVPFTVLTAMFLSDEVFSHVEVENGRVMTMDGEQIVVGIAMPGLTDCLKLTDYEPTEEITIPEYVELTADVTDFEMEFTATVASPGILEDMELENLDDVDEMIDDMQALLDASSELVEGTAELTKGAGTMSSYLTEYVKGVSEINRGTSALADYLNTLDDNTQDLEEGVEALAGGLQDIEKALDGLELPKDIVDADAAEAAAALAKDAKALSQALAAAQDALNQIAGFRDEASSYVSNMKSVIATVKKELVAIDLSGVGKDATQKARDQAKGALEKALKDTDLTDEQKKAIVSEVTGSIDLSDVASGAQSHLDAALAALADLPELEIPELSVDVNGIAMTIDDMKAQLSVLQAYADSASEQLNENLPALLETLALLDGSIGSLSDGSDALVEGARSFAGSVSQLAEGANQLKKGTSQLASYGGQITEGFGTLIKGMKALKEGMETFDEEGVQSLGDLAGDDLASVLEHVRAVKAADDGYINFGGIQTGQSGSVRFIMETEAIEK